jgi:N-acyl-D-amino-acid deacylase
VILRGGTVYDGSLGSPHVLDVRIKGDKIVEIGKLNDSSAETIDVAGCIVTPGFIDVHNHTDVVVPILRSMLRVEDVPELKGIFNYLFQGVTTIVTGNCGLGYTSIDEWFDYLDSLHFGTNVYHLAPHGNIRLELFGKEQPTRLTPAQMQVFKKKLEEEIEKGAIGFSSGLEYAPGWLADRNELIEIADVVKKKGGIYTTHMRSESGEGIIGAMEEAIEIGRRTGISVQISHLKLGVPYNKSVTIEKVLSLIENAHKQGLDVSADQYPYSTSSTYLTWLLEDKSFLLNDNVKPEFKTDDGKALIAKAVSNRFKYLGPENVLMSWCPQNPEYDGKTLRQLGDQVKKDPAELYADLVCGEKMPMAILFGQDASVVKEIMRHGYVFTSSDGSVLMKGAGKYHPRCYASFTKKIKQFALDEKTIDLNFAIRSMTSLPAEKFKMKGRGRIAEGCFADIAVIDIGKIRDNTTYESPDNLSDGVVHLFVNGVHAIENGKFTGQTGGKPLRR